MHPYPYSLHPYHYNLHPCPYSANPYPYSANPYPYSLHTSPYSVRLSLVTVAAFSDAIAARLTDSSALVRRRAMDAMALIDAERQSLRCTARGHDQHDLSLHDVRCSVPHV